MSEGIRDSRAFSHLRTMSSAHPPIVIELAVVDLILMSRVKETLCLNRHGCACSDANDSRPAHARVGAGAQRLGRAADRSLRENPEARKP